jgi:hypothetical protein
MVSCSNLDVSAHRLAGWRAIRRTAGRYRRVTNGARARREFQAANEFALSIPRIEWHNAFVD